MSIFGKRQNKRFLFKKLMIKFGKWEVVSFLKMVFAPTLYLANCRWFSSSWGCNCCCSWMERKRERERDDDSAEKREDQDFSGSGRRRDSPREKKMLVVMEHVRLFGILKRGGKEENVFFYRHSNSQIISLFLKKNNVFVCPQTCSTGVWLQRR